MLKKVSNILITGRGVVAERKISSGEFLVEYRGELLSSEEGERRGKKIQVFSDIFSNMEVIKLGK